MRRSIARYPKSIAIGILVLAALPATGQDKAGKSDNTAEQKQVLPFVWDDRQLLDWFSDQYLQKRLDTVSRDVKLSDQTFDDLVSIISDKMRLRGKSEKEIDELTEGAWQTRQKSFKALRAANPPVRKPSSRPEYFLPEVPGPLNQISHQAISAEVVKVAPPSGANAASDGEESFATAELRGKVLDTFPNNQVLVSFGGEQGAKKGLRVDAVRFLGKSYVYYVGEIELVDVGARHSVGRFVTGGVGNRFAGVGRMGPDVRFPVFAGPVGADVLLGRFRGTYLRLVLENNNVELLRAEIPSPKAVHLPWTPLFGPGLDLEKLFTPR